MKQQQLVSASPYCVYTLVAVPYAVLPPAGGLGNFIYMQLTDTDAPSKTGEGEVEEEKAARLVSLPVTAPDADLCMSFWYHMFGEHAGALHIKQRKEGEGGQILWTVSGHQGNRWREGRVLLPHSSASYQVRGRKTVPMWFCVNVAHESLKMRSDSRTLNTVCVLFSGGGGRCSRQTQHRSHSCGQHPDHRRTEHRGL